MIKFDRDVHQALRTLEKAGFETYAVGDCVRDLVRGVYAYDWDLVTKATVEDLKRIFPDGKFMDDDKQVMRIDYTYEVAGKDEDEPSHLEGAILDIHPIEGDVDAELEKENFTIEAMADNPGRRFVDPYGGKEDVKKKLVRTISDADAMFKAKPIRMMEAVTLAAEMGFDLHKSVFDAILANWRLLLDHEIAPIREQLERLLVSDNAGKGLSMMAESGLMAVIFGEEVSRKMSHNDMRAFNEVCAHIDETKPVRLRRLGLLYTVLNKKPGMAAVDRMEFDERDKQHLYDALTEMINIQFLGEDKTFKRYLFEHGMERYNYLHNLSKAQRIVYDQPTVKIESRNYMMKKIRANNEPVFVEDLVIDANDIMEAGITDSPEKAEELLSSVIAVVHNNPKNNQRDVLLKQAKKYSKNKFAQKTRYVRWIK